MLIFFVCTIIGFTSQAEAPASAKFVWEKTTHDFGRLELNQPASAVFTFINEGEVPLIISQVKVGCGCTVASYTQEAIAPGATGRVEATYNAAKAGAFHKTVTVYANTGSEPIQLSLVGTVE